MNAETGKVFISYRRADSGPLTGRIKDWLAQHFGDDNVYLDVSMPGGIDFESELDKRLRDSHALVVVIGESWATVQDSETNELRLFSESDLVRREIEVAIDLQIPIIPVLTGRAEFPTASQLPDSLLPLLRWNAKRVSHEDFEHSIRSVIEAVDNSFSQAGVSRDASKARSWSEAGEVSSWDFVRERRKIDELKDHIERFPGGDTERLARALLSDLEFDEVAGSENVELLNDYAERYPGTANARMVLERINALHAKTLEASRKAARAEKAAFERAERKSIRRRYFLRGGVAAGVLTSLGAAVSYNWREIRAFGMGNSKASFGSGSGFFESVDVSPDGRYAISASLGVHQGTVLLWDIDSAKVLREYQGHYSPSCASYSPDGRYIATGDDGRMLRLWKVEGTEPLLRSEFPDFVTGVSFLKDNENILVGHGKTVELWSAASRKSLWKVRSEGHFQGILKEKYGKGFFALFRGGEIQKISSRGRAENRWRLGEKFGELSSAYIFNNARSAALGGGDGIIRHVDLRSMEIVWERYDGSDVQQAGRRHFIGAVLVMPEKGLVVAGTSSGFLRVLSLDDGSELAELVGHTKGVTSIVRVPGKDQVLSSAADGTIRLWEI